MANYKRKLFSGYSNWSTYQLGDRRAPWKLLLPISSNAPILAIGLKGDNLESLARSWKMVHEYECSDREFEWAKRQAQSLGHNCSFTSLTSLTPARSTYHAVAISAEFEGVCSPIMALGLLEPGGSLARVRGRDNILYASGQAFKGFESVRTYTLLPTNSGEILLPLSNGKLTRAGLNLYMPGRWQSRLAVRVGKVASGLGFQRLLATRQVFVARKPGRLDEGQYLLDKLGVHIGCPITDATVYAGWKNFTLLLLDNRGLVIGVAKVADTKLGAASLNREMNILRRLAIIPEIQGFVPKILGSGDFDGYSFSIQSDIHSAGTGYATKLTSEHLRFLTALSRIDRCEMTLNQWPRWSEIRRWAYEWEFISVKEAEAVRTAIERCALKLDNARIPFHRFHGDFSPWNVLPGSNGLGVVDWEDSEAMGLPLFDAVHFAIRVMTSLRKKALSLAQPSCVSRLALGIDGELNSLVSSLSLTGSHGMTSDQIEALIALCIIVAAKERRLL